MKFVHLALFTYLSLTTAIVGPHEVDTYKYAFRFGEQATVDLSNFNHDNVPSFEKFQQNKHRFESYNEFLDYLQQQYPVLFDQHVLVHRTGSLQFASKERPRVLMFDGTTFLSFAEPPHTNVRRVEMIQFDPATRKFSPREIVFEPGEKPRFNENPKSCLSCHGKETKPLWLPYDFWPGTYGSSIGRTGGRDEQNHYHQVFKAPADQIYSRLNETPRPAGTTYVTPVESFTMMVTSLNLLRASRKIKGAGIGPYIYPIFAALNRCHDNGHDFASFFPDDVYRSLPISLESIDQDTTNARVWLKGFLQNIYEDIFSLEEPLFPMNHDRLATEIPVVTRLRFVLENLGISTRDLLTGRGINDFFFSTPSNFSFDFLSALSLDFREEMLKAGASFPRSRHLFGWPHMRCNDIRDASLAAFTVNDGKSLIRELHLSYKRRGRDLPPIGRCIKCHSAGHFSRPPSIPFHNTVELARLLRETDLKQEIFDRIDRQGQGAMPPRAPLTEEEKESVRDFLNTLAE